MVHDVVCMYVCILRFRLIRELSLQVRIPEAAVLRLTSCPQTDSPDYGMSLLSQLLLDLVVVGGSAFVSALTRVTQRLRHVLPGEFVWTWNTRFDGLPALPG